MGSTAPGGSFFPSGHDMGRSAPLGHPALAGGLPVLGAPDAFPSHLLRLSSLASREGPATMTPPPPVLLMHLVAQREVAFPGHLASTGQCQCPVFGVLRAGVVQAKGTHPKACARAYVWLYFEGRD